MVTCVSACDDGEFGSDCAKSCQCLDNTTPCDKERGECLGGDGNCTYGKFTDREKPDYDPDNYHCQDGKQ